MEIGNIIKLSSRPGKQFVVLKSDIGPHGRYITVLELGAGHRPVPYTLEEILSGQGMTVSGKLRIAADKLIRENTVRPDTTIPVSTQPDDISAPPAPEPADEVVAEITTNCIPELNIYEMGTDELFLATGPIMATFEVPDSTVPEDV